MSRQSPLIEVASGNTVIQMAAVSITEKPFFGHYILRGLSGNTAFTTAVSTIIGVDLPLKSNTVSRSDGLLVCWMSPDQWLLVTDNDEYSNKLSVLRGALEDEFASINDVSSGQTIINIKGKKANEVLCKGTTFDVHPSVFTPGQCAQVIFAKSNVLIYPLGLNEYPEYDLIVRRSFADFLARWLSNACHEYRR